LLGTLRQDAKARHTWLLDITTDIGLPVIAALSCSGDGRGVACGLASRTSLLAAARAALLELCQMELAILLAQARLAERGEASLTVADRQCLARATKLDANCCELLHPLGAPGLHDEPTDQAQLPAIARVLMQAGVEAALVDLTRPQNDIQVVRAVAPALQPLPSDIVTPRLLVAIADTGGRARHTGGIPLL
jgi:ribosomal protein S12 methylthiotransferase accessory factor